MACNTNFHRCLVHFDSVQSSNLIRFTTKSLKRVTECRKEWMKYDSEPLKNICMKSFDLFPQSEGENWLEETISELFYHRQCYQRFTDCGKLKRASDKKKKSKEVGSDQNDVVSVKHLRSSVKKPSTCSVGAKSGHVLPAVCIICNKETIYKTVSAYIDYFVY